MLEPGSISSSLCSFNYIVCHNTPMTHTIHALYTTFTNKKSTIHVGKLQHYMDAMGHEFSDASHAAKPCPKQPAGFQITKKNNVKWKVHVQSFVRQQNDAPTNNNKKDPSGKLEKKTRKKNKIYIKNKQLKSTTA